MSDNSRLRRLATNTRTWITLFPIVAVSLSFRSYFVRELLSALLLFTALFVVVAVLVMLVILFEQALEGSVVAAASIVRLLRSSIHDVNRELCVSTMSHTSAGRRAKNHNSCIKLPNVTTNASL
jgi:hypothetical protein